MYHNRETFYVGGDYVMDSQGNRSLQGQMYVEHLSPDYSRAVNHPPIVFIHGATRTGNDWLTKPDGNPGWAFYFLSEGYEVYLVDLPFRGRSPWFPGNGTLVAYPAEHIQKMFTATKTFDLWPQAKLHTQWPGTGMISDPIFDQIAASTIQMINDPVLQESAGQAACGALLDKINRPAILIGHSSGGSMPLLVADIRPGLVKMIIALEPMGPPFFKATTKLFPGGAYGVTHAPITYDPPVNNPAVDLVRNTIRSTSPLRLDCTLQAEVPPPRKLVNLEGIRILVVTAQASYHARYDWSSVLYLRQAGVNVDHLKLEDKGILGNGHMMYMEKNSDIIAAEIKSWIEEIEKTTNGT